LHFKYMTAAHCSHKFQFEKRAGLPYRAFCRDVPVFKPLPEASTLKN
jgi:hypothetical protein